MNRVLVFEKLELMASVWVSALSAEADIRVVGRAANVEEAAEALGDCDVILVSASVPESEAVRLIRTTTLLQPPVRVVVAGIPRSAPAILRYVELGVHGFVLQEGSVGEVIECIRAVCSGGAQVRADLAPLLMSHLARLRSAYVEPEVQGSRYEQLTPREREVLNLVAQRFTNQQIAERLVIEVGTVKNHVHSILHKLQLNSRYEAASFLRSLFSFRSPAHRVGVPA